MYEYNFIFSDDILENLISQIAQSLRPLVSQQYLQVSEKKASIIDSYALSYRGLAWIYAKGLLDLGFEVQYLAPSRMKNDERFQPLKSWLEKSGVSIELFPTDSLANQATTTLNAISKHSPQNVLFHGTPWDVNNLAIIDSLPSQINKLFINLTDHAFWLGAKEFDTYIEFREYGAIVSEKYRHIARNKLAFLPYYPIHTQNHPPFEGLPFKARNPFFVSGGAAFKTEGDPTFSSLVSKILSEFPSLFFLFLSERKPEWFSALHKQYPDRVFFQKERNDLFEVISQSEFYLSTYPYYGALMTQIAAAAGTIPFTLHFPGHEPSSCVLPLNSVTIDYDTCEALITEIHKIESNPEYKKRKSAEIQSAISNPEIFSSSLKKILSGECIRFPSNSNLKINPESLSSASLKHAGSFLKLSETCAEKQDISHLTIFDIESICGLVIKIRKKIKGIGQ